MPMIVRTYDGVIGNDVMHVQPSVESSERIYPAYT